MAWSLFELRGRGRGRLVLLSFLACAAADLPALALEEGKDEKNILRACERQVCEIMLKKSPSGDDLKCTIEKTWAKSTIKNGVDKKISWTAGDARCSMKLHLNRAQLVMAMTAPQHKFVFPPHLISCQIEEEKDVRNIRVLLAPEVEFKNGIATGGKVRVKKIDAPLLFKTGIWTAATLIDKVGMFQKELTKEINKLSQKRCPEVYGDKPVVAKKLLPGKRKAAAASAAAGSGDKAAPNDKAKPVDKADATAPKSAAKPASSGDKSKQTAGQN